MRRVQVDDDLLMNNGAFSEVDLVGTHISGQFDLRNSEVADLTPGLLDKLHPKADLVPCPPVSRGKEVSADAMMHPACRVIEAKAFLLHAQNAVLEWAFNAR